jgi:hypothetical protein
MRVPQGFVFVTMGKREIQRHEWLTLPTQAGRKVFFIAQGRNLAV